jgi:hypothetical protein
MEQLQALPVGQRDARLLEMREALFGTQLTCLTSCPRCGEKLELALQTGQLRSTPPDGQASASHTLSAGQVEVKFRLPNSADLLQIADLADASQARATLLERCVQQVTRSGAPLSVSELPEDVLSGITERMAQIDPQADIQIALTCPACAWQWSSLFDIVSYLWSEINTWAIRMLREVHQLASVYGWRESDILALSPLRRQLYLELIG